MMGKKQMAAKMKAAARGWLLMNLSVFMFLVAYDEISYVSRNSEDLREDEDRIAADDGIDKDDA
jgi:hypothetical protein